ncbi:MAG TPA: type II secretion system F family protein [Actinomycetes bacterium]|nr:type II secretion system F family protein [Actinomycetes bacterium]
MSAIVLVAGAVALAGAVFAALFSVQSLIVERRQAYRTIRALRSIDLRPTDIRNRELAEPARDRVWYPLYRTALALGRRLTPVGARQNIQRKLLMAGSPIDWDADRVLASKVGGLAAGALAGVLLVVGMPLPWGMLVVGFLALCLLGYFMPNIVLTNKIQRRQAQVRRALPDSIDLLTISVEAGLGFDAALAHVSRNTTGPLADEFYRTLQEVQLGRTRSEAMRNLADRSTVPELSTFVLAMVQADVFGISVANVLRIQSREMRKKRRQLAEERAMKVPIKVLFPVLFCIFPALFVVILGPAIMRIAEAFSR